MVLSKHSIETLNQLGLTLLEARIYLALCKHENLTTKDISKLTKTSQPDTYRVLATLQEKGLIEKIIKRPAVFNIIPCEKSILSLLEKKRSNYVDLETKTKLLLCSLKEESTNKSLEKVDSQFIMIPQKQAVVMRIRQAIERATKSVDLVLSWKRFEFGITTAFTKSLEMAGEKEVKFRIVIEKPEKKEDLKKAIEFGRNYAFCEIRFLLHCPKTVTGLYDKNEVFIIVNPQKGLLDSSALWSNNQSLISLVHDYFEITWLTSIEELIKNTLI